MNSDFITAGCDWSLKWECEFDMNWTTIGMLTDKRNCECCSELESSKLAKLQEPWTCFTKLEMMANIIRLCEEQHSNKGYNVQSLS